MDNVVFVLSEFTIKLVFQEILIIYRDTWDACLSGCEKYVIFS